MVFQRPQSAIGKIKAEYVNQPMRSVERTAGDHDEPATALIQKVSQVHEDFSGF
jgi:hypothetical protein